MTLRVRTREEVNPRIRFGDFSSAEFLALSLLTGHPIISNREVAAILQESFHWSSTPEGFEFWQGVYDYLNGSGRYRLEPGMPKPPIPQWRRHFLDMMTIDDSDIEYNDSDGETDEDF